MTVRKVHFSLSIETDDMLEDYTALEFEGNKSAAADHVLNKYLTWWKVGKQKISEQREREAQASANSKV